MIGPLPLPDPALRDESVGLVLRRWGAWPGDAGALAAAWAEPDVQRWCAVPPARTFDDAARWVAGEAQRRARHGALDLVVADTESTECVCGEVGLIVVDAERGFAEVGYWVLPRFRGQALATASVNLLSAWALQTLRVRRLFARVSAENPASARVVANAGYALVGHAADGVLEVWVRDRPS